jgi:hypothetical protein
VRTASRPEAIGETEKLLLIDGVQHLRHGPLHDLVLQTMNPHLSLSYESLAAFCRSRGIRRLAVFGSALRPDFTPESDIDVLVEFELECVHGPFGLARAEGELSILLVGGKVDMRTAENLSRYFRKKVIAEAEAQYAA